MHLTSSQLRYLFVLKEITDERGQGAKIKLEDLSDTLKVSKPSVHRMMEVFKNLGILEEKRGIAGLTQLGAETAEAYSKRYQLIDTYLKDKVGVGESEADELAISILGCSETSVDAYIAKAAF